jgi:hypothetical protein
MSVEDMKLNKDDSLKYVCKISLVGQHLTLGKGNIHNKIASQALYICYCKYATLLSVNAKIFGVSFA